MPYRLGIDLGTNSLGWCAVELGADGAPMGVRDGGVRIYSDGREAKTGASLAVDRRNARAMRRRRDRYLRRREVLLDELVCLGLLPADEADRKALAQLDPYHIRAVALDDKIPLHFLGRALFHLNQRRGFKSNRKADRAADPAELGVVAPAIDNLDAAIEAAGVRTYGEFLAMRHARDPEKHDASERRTRIRRDDAESEYAFYPARRHLEAEFDALWLAQQPHYPTVLNDATRARIERVIFYQRPLKSPAVGRCAYTTELRVAKAHPLFQRLRLVKSINELTVEEIGQAPRPLTREQRDNVLRAWRAPTETKRSMTWGAIRKAAGLPRNSRFKGEDRRGKGLVGDEVEAELVKLYGPSWRGLSLDAQWRIIERLKEEEDEALLLAFLTEEIGLDEDKACVVAKARLPEGHGRIGATAATRILAELEAEVIPESEAVARSGWHHSDHRTGEVWDRLPYYGEILDRQIPPGTQDPDDAPEECYGRITNPTVHIGLGQLRRVINAIIDRHGLPHDIVVELARDLKLSEDEKAEINRTIKRNTDAAIRRGKMLEDIGIANTGENRVILKLWEDLHPDPKARVCIYTGRPIGVEILFSGETDIDHILPIRLTLDDSEANKLVCVAAANRRKGRRSPFDAFGTTAEWDAILSRAQHLPPGKRWRFAPDALSRFGDESGFLARQLTDTQYLSRLAKEYLGALYPERGDGSQRVRVIPGRLTEMLRRNWGLNSLLPDHNYAQTAKHKNRLDHRHHLIDAFVAALTEQRLMQKVATAAGHNDDQGLAHIFKDMPEPWSDFRDDLKALLDRTVVSHKPDHGTIASAADKAIGKDCTAGRLHNDTAYGLTGETDAKGNAIVVRRVPLLSLDNDQKVAAVRDSYLRTELERALHGAVGKAREAALRRFASEHPVYRNIRRVRVIEPLKTVPVRDATGRAYKGYKGDANYRYDVWQLPDGKWVANVVTMFEAHQIAGDGQEWRPHPAAKRVLRLHQNDMVGLDHPQYGACICRVVKFSEKGQITLARHNEAGALKARDSDPNDPFKYFSPTAGGLKKVRIRQVRIDETGRVWDPGPRD